MIGFSLRTRARSPAQLSSNQPVPHCARVMTMMEDVTLGADLARASQKPSYGVRTSELASERVRCSLRDSGGDESAQARPADAVDVVGRTCGAKRKTFTRRATGDARRVIGAGQAFER